MRRGVSLGLTAIIALLALAAAAQADRKPTSKERRAIAKVVKLPAHCATVRVSTATKKPTWGSVSFKPGPSDCEPFASDGVTVVRKTGGAWRFVTAGSDFTCSELFRDVPETVVRDLRIPCRGSSTASAAKKRKKKDSLNLGLLPLGDRKISTAPLRGSVWSCQPGGGPSPSSGPWIHGTTWSLLEKPIVQGAVAWPGAISTTRVGAIRRIISNDLPLGHTTGVFPIQPGTTAFQYDRNMSSIAAHAVDLSLPAFPVLSTPSCVAGEVGVLDTGVAIFSAFDAALFDAPAHEVQDSCSGHPNNAGYHYHSLPACLKTGKKNRHSNRIGWALDGFPIFGPRGEDGEYMKDSDLDGCHGHMHEIKFNGKTRRVYHYHLTQEFPYSIGCFRGTPVSRMVLR